MYVVMTARYGIAVIKSRAADAQNGPFIVQAVLEEVTRHLQSIHLRPYPHRLPVRLGEVQAGASITARLQSQQQTRRGTLST